MGARGQVDPRDEPEDDNRATRDEAMAKAVVLALSVLGELAVAVTRAVERSN